MDRQAHARNSPSSLVARAARVIRARILCQNDARPQAGMVVLQLELAAVQPGHRIDQAESQTHPGRAAAGIAAVEALDRLGFLGIRNARAAVGDHDLDAAIVRRTRTATVMVPSSGVYLSALSIRLPSACASSTGSPRIGAGPPLSSVKRRAPELRGRLIELDRRGRDLGQVHRHEAGAAHAAVDLGQPQQRIEDADHAIDVGHRRIDLGKGLLGRRPGQRQLLQPRAQLRQRRAQIVRDRIGDIAHAMDQLLDLIEHAVDGLRQRVELIAAADRSAAGDSDRPA